MAGGAGTPAARLTMTPGAPSWTPPVGSGTAGSPVAGTTRPWIPLTACAGEVAPTMPNPPAAVSERLSARALTAYRRAII